MRERILSEIRRVIAQTGVVPGVRKFEIETGILRREWTGKIWARWSDAIKEAGFEPNALNERLSSDVVLSKVAECCLALGRMPTSNDMRLYSRTHAEFPSNTTIENHFPKKVLLVEALRAWITSSGESEYASVLSVLPEPVGSKTEIVDQQSYGHVYLLQAGDFFKIGQSSDLERRVKAINVALPDKATLAHAISTDDPPGIEAYWHRRFADRRANGEWFKLSRADVLAFKKRKFQ
jgi:hypothetical protein